MKRSVSPLSLPLLTCLLLAGCDLLPGPGGTSTSLPDLVVRTNEPQSWPSDRRVTVRIRNDGPGALILQGDSILTYVNVVEGPDRLGQIVAQRRHWFDVPAVCAGCSYQVTADFSDYDGHLPASPTVHAIVDPKDEIEEADEANNTASFSL